MNNLLRQISNTPVTDSLVSTPILRTQIRISKSYNNYHK